MNVKRTPAVLAPRLRSGAVCQVVNLGEEANGLLVEVVASSDETVTCKRREWPEVFLFIPPQCLRPVTGEPR